MSCRRADKTRLVGCRIGDLAMRGCTRGCCPYPDSAISENTRPHLLKEYWPPVYIKPEDRRPGRTGLYWAQCMSSYSPKFICPERTCRRGIKPFYDPERFEYDISEWQDWKTRPVLTSPQMKEVIRNGESLSPKKRVLNPEKAEFKRLSKLWYDNPNLLTAEEREFVKKYDTFAWWVTIFSHSRGPNSAAENMKRCPSCGKTALPVGSNFRIPKRKDQKAWREVESMIKAAVDLVWKFSPCASDEEWRVMVEKANAIRGRDKDEVVELAG